MTTTVAAEARTPPRVTRKDPLAPILIATGRTGISIRAGTVFEIDDRAIAFDAETPLDTGDLVPGRDYGVGIDPDGRPVVTDVHSANPLQWGFLAGFHFAPGGNAEGKAGGDRFPAINPFSLWDIDFRPACPDPRGMTLVSVQGDRRVWLDIYLLGTGHSDQGTSRHGARIATGATLPKLDYQTAVDIYASHGKRLPGAEEFFAGAYGVEEQYSRDEAANTAGEMEEKAERFISRFGLFDATGTVWQWGTDGHPDIPRPSIFGGSWVFGSSAGSRVAYLDNWPGDSGVYLGARGACDHL